MKFWKPAFLGLALLAAACGEKPSVETTTPAPPAAEASPKGPALWKVGDADTTIYLFGTVHVLPPELVWRTADIDKALSESKAIYFETDIDPDPAKLLPFIQGIGMYPPSQTLSDRLKPVDRTALAAAAAKLDYPMAALDRMKPWFAAVNLSELMITNAGYEVNSGVERKLSPDAISSGKQVRKLETVEEQLGVFAGLPEDVQIQFLMDGVKQMDEESKTLDDMVKAWAAGETDKLDKIMIEQDLAESPPIYEALLVKRNSNWVKKLDELIKTEPGTFFVAVGAAHLIGKDSVIAQLAPMGHVATRIE
jgi:uncharacterized protein YbaP (TraB family)